ncbi:MAG: hypothetical protein IJX66_05860, partial [Lachnospiraceae bacterium]|nr:hypothetical protein [Lachnospiraceae bacterium]
MSRFKSFVCFILIAEILLGVLCNGLYLYGHQTNAGRLYRVETNRVAMELQETVMAGGNPEDMDLSDYESVIRVSKFQADEACNNDYVVEEVNGTLYRIEYHIENNFSALFYINAALLGMILVTGTVLFYVYKKVLKPFQSMSNLSLELAKGNLSTPVKEEKSKLFGRF